MKPLAVLVADDVAEIRMLLVAWLSEGGHCVTCAGTGSEAAQLMRRQHFDLIVTDIIMPDGDGLELIAQAKKSAPLTRILAMSGGGRYLDQKMYLKMSHGFGAHALLQKPFNREQFMTSVNRTLARS